MKSEEAPETIEWEQVSRYPPCERRDSYALGSGFDGQTGGVWITLLMTGWSTPHRSQTSKQLKKAEAVRDDRMDEDTTSSYCRLKGRIPMLSEADLIAKRAALWWLTQQHPQWSHQDLADALAMSRSWESRVAPAVAPSRS